VDIAGSEKGEHWYSCRSRCTCCLKMSTMLSVKKHFNFFVNAKTPSPDGAVHSCIHKKKHIVG
jgi:hypothetical protein